MNIMAVLEKFVSHLERQRADLVAHGARFQDQTEDQLQELLKSIDEVKAKLEAARPGAAKLAGNLAAMKEKMSAVKQARARKRPLPTPPPSPWAPVGWPLNDAQIAEAIAALLSRARPAAAPKPPTRRHGSDVVDMSSGAWETETPKKSDVWDTEE